jgi:hypothetical protein
VHMASVTYYFKSEESCWIRSTFTNLKISGASGLG